MKATLAVFLAVAVIAVYANCIQNGVEYKTNETWTLGGQCAQATCQEGGSVAAVNCPLIRVKEGWTLTKEDLTKKYPACCPKAVKTTCSCYNC